MKGGWRQGRQRKRWEDNIREWTGLEFAKSQRAVENREKWRKLVAKSSVVPQRPSRLRDRWWWCSFTMKRDGQCFRNMTLKEKSFLMSVFTVASIQLVKKIKKIAWWEKTDTGGARWVSNNHWLLKDYFLSRACLHSLHSESMRPTGEYPVEWTRGFASGWIQTGILSKEVPDVDMWLPGLVS